MNKSDGLLKKAASNDIASFGSAEYSVLDRAGWAARVYGLSDGTFIAGYETSYGIVTRISEDGCKTWSDKTPASFRPDKACANVNFYEADTELYLAYRAIGDTENGFYTSLQVSVSDDMGRTWRHHSTVCEYLDENHFTSGVWEPYLGVMDGKLVCVYANDLKRITEYQNIERMEFDGVSWGGRIILSNGTEHSSRDGMPVWIRLSDGSYLMAIESTSMSDDGFPFVIQLLRSVNGADWESPRTVYHPVSYGSKASAPGLCLLNDGRIVLTFQTDEDSDLKGDNYSSAKYMILSGNSEPLASAVNIYGGEYSGTQTWGGVYSDGEAVYYASGSPLGAAMAILR